MRWFGFGFNAFEQVCVHGKATEGEAEEDENVKVRVPLEVKSECGLSCSKISVSWSRRATLYLEDGDNCVCLAGFGTVSSAGSCGVSVAESRGCKDAFICESHLTLAFPDRIEIWDLQKKETCPKWSMKTESQSENTAEPILKLPLVHCGYIATKAPFYRSLLPHLKAKSLALGSEHVVLLCSTGAVYTWGLGSHGQLGHGGLKSEEDPRPVEALWGMTMSCVATGGWHSVCISDGGDLYVWGWNESGQLGLPSRGVRKTLQEKSDSQTDANVSPGEEAEDGEDQPEVFISIQAFPALLDVTPSCEIRAVSCGSRHTAAVTTTGDLYTWGWGEYGQLGHQTLLSSDEPQRVEFFREQHMRVVDVSCGAWNTFAAAVKKEVLDSQTPS